MTTSDTPKDILDEILTNYAQDYNWSKRSGINKPSDFTRQAKQQILKQYISYDEVERLIGEDERYLDCAVCKGELPKSTCSSGQCLVYSGRNKLKAELKAALKKRRES